MPSCALLLCSIAAVLGTLAVTPVAPDLRLVVDAGLGALAVGAALGRPACLVLLLRHRPCRRRRSTRSCRQRSATAVVEHRTARYSGTLLEESSTGDGSTGVELALDTGLRLLARVRAVRPPIGTRSDDAGKARTV